MKREGILTIGMVLILVVLIGSVIYINNPDMFQKKKEVLEQDSSYSTFNIWVEEGRFESKYATEGTVEEYGETSCIQEMILEGNVKESIPFQSGDEIESGTVLYDKEENLSKVDFNGRIIGVEEVNEITVIRLLNYDALCVSATVEADVLKKLEIGTKAYITINDKDYEAEVVELGYRVKNGRVDIKCSLPKRMLPGSDVEVKLVTAIRDNVKYVPETAVYSIGNFYYVYLCEGEEIKKTPVEIGEILTDNNGIYYEITSGISTGDKLSVEDEKDYGSNLEETLTNE